MARRAATIGAIHSGAIGRRMDAMHTAQGHRQGYCQGYCKGLPPGLGTSWLPARETRFHAHCSWQASHLQCLPRSSPSMARGSHRTAVRGCVSVPLGTGFMRDPP